jgi:uncharacterized protein
MSDTSAHEPTMEEILASIRRIISEDDAPANPQPAKPVVSVVAKTETIPEPEDIDSDEDVLELTETVSLHRPGMSIGDIDAFDAPSAPVNSPSTPSFAPREAKVEPIRPSLVNENTAQAAMSAFSQLSNTSLMPAGGRTLEDLIVELLRPQLQDWLDSNLPSIVEEAVRSEVERIARQSRR